MALEPEKTPKAKKTPAKKASAKKTPVKKTPAKKATVKKTTVKKATVKKQPVKKETAAKNSEKTEKKETVMSTKDNAQSNEGFEKGLGNAKLEQTGNVADKVWRLIAMTAFAFIGNFTLFAIVVLSAMQFVVVFMEDKPNKEVQNLVTKLEGYLSEIISFLAYRTNIMPFPFSSFPKNKD